MIGVQLGKKRAAVHSPAQGVPQLEDESVNGIASVGFRVSPTLAGNPLEHGGVLDDGTEAGRHGL